jgi:GNAT superfamily N-acetyltransferase
VLDDDRDRDRPEVERREGCALRPGRRLAGLVHRVRRVAQREGPRGVLFRTLERCGYRRLAWFARPLDPLRPDARIAVEVARLDAGDVDDYLTLRPDARRGLPLERLQAGSLCFAARDAGRLVSVTWVATGRVQLSAGELVLEEGEIFLYDSFTDPAFRGRRIQMAILASLLEYYRAGGWRYAVVMIVPENRASIRSRERSGFRRTATMHYLRLGRRCWSLFRGERAP